MAKLDFLWHNKKCYKTEFKSLTNIGWCELKARTKYNKFKQVKHPFCHSDEGGIALREQLMRFLLLRNDNKTD